MEHANADFVTGRLLVGGDLDAFDEGLQVSQLDELVRAGVTHIVDVRLEWSDAELVRQLAPQIHYLHHGVDDVGQQIPDDWFDTGVDYVLNALGEPEAVVLSHCHMGINRGPSLGYAVMLAQGWDPVQAAQRICTVRPIAYVGYAEDALRWHHQRRGTGLLQRREDRRRLSQWRKEHDRDIAGVTRGIRPRG